MYFKLIGMDKQVIQKKEKKKINKSKYNIQV